MTTKKSWLVSCCVGLSIAISGLPLREAAAQAPANPPVSLRNDISVEYFMPVEPEAMRILENDQTGAIHYITFDGNVFRVTDHNGKPESKLLVAAKEHGIPRLQGAAFYKGRLFLAGNYNVNNNKGNKGRMVRYNLDEQGNPVKMTEVFNTVEYGANKTTFDHGWNALEVSPDGKYIYVNTGARTDHGEVQDNDGAYPGARDNALTAKIFRFPINAENLILEDDEAKLKAEGYIYADGIRNAYDMAFDKKGRLFAVSNSGDYDHPEDMFWVRKGHHYGFPWIMGGIENPQQYPDYQPNPDTDPFLSKFAFAWMMKYFHNDPDFPKKPEGVKFTPAIQNLGPDANEYRDPKTGKVVDGDSTGKTIGTLNAHSSPLGLFFDNENALAGEFKGDGFVIRYNGGPRRGLNNPNPLLRQGKDLLHLDLVYDKKAANFKVRTTRIVEGFTAPTDALLINNTAYIIEYGGKQGGNKNGGSIWKITFPSGKQSAQK